MDQNCPKEEEQKKKKKNKKRNKKKKAKNDEQLDSIQVEKKCFMEDKPTPKTGAPMSSQFE